MAPYEDTPSDIVFKGGSETEDQEAMQNAETKLWGY